MAPAAAPSRLLGLPPLPLPVAAATVRKSAALCTQAYHGPITHT